MPATTNPSSGGGLVVIHVALFRIATKSMAEAYSILGYKVHHGRDDVFNNPWPQIEAAAEATWPSVPGARPRAPFTRADWDRLWGSEFDIVTDMASPFVRQLIVAYPDAKVVVVQRDFDSWWPSFTSELLDSLFTHAGRLLTFVAWHAANIRSGAAIRKVHLGFFGARSLDDIPSGAGEAYKQYYANVHALVPPERRLEYKMGDGWGPLCKFWARYRMWIYRD
ncbi:Uu.00g021270.m01.CDS01 [Anthostomella pinea]|uniref:Uu.00g021270.m01.CDS01 n=1 Tax=Anthostomella pinea TaxID=933095 RepID=A0AAI8W0V0_9PEZI|nr:Uu.00g021270.m01.CDS01 [Anthostomella pinea]